MWAVPDFVHPISFRGIHFLCPIPVSGHHVGYLGLGLGGPPMGGSVKAGPDSEGPSHPQQEQGTGTASASNIGHLAGTKDSVVVALPATEEALTSGHLHVLRCSLLVLFNILLLMRSIFMWHWAFLTLVPCQMRIIDKVLSGIMKTTMQCCRSSYCQKCDWVLPAFLLAPISWLYAKKYGLTFLF